MSTFHGPACGALVQARGLTVARRGRTVLDGLDLDLHAGERLFVRGACGAGKTTLLHALLGFVPAAAGSIRLLGRSCRCERDFAPLRGPLGMLFQDSGDQLFGPTVIEDVAFGPLNQGLDADAASARAFDALRRIGIAGLAARPVHELSGGQQRLAALAGVLAMRPRVLLLDEPTAALDAASAARITAILAGSGLPMIVASHDEALAAALATRSIDLSAPDQHPARRHVRGDISFPV
ncbi:energy-coupling factor ABC transporter ATP-binding protein [Thauera linaloolentis]|uniref:Putative cobalt transport system ATP-binding protein n=1 Tax=Thauera linaloolentis (strain DSM 12138 / JCM 21573 / CCUG 41526 / CIP 105981 / IAM 15112 / NBRC 102519 / 47Lol) TaxID=1123367 RepID=N6YXS7_THAL4|nr:ABC transporter ATP-binding protein [Thauera linaloolentis]ENO84744.1 putative cobalt transport system ATP-binding protein [Thauera linaloolentis 47Lol = DSM 12138]MCM8567507.1 energy-coupling factor ABC transporter ATP-binding protein [Thauera linaloolentis]